MKKVLYIILMLIICLAIGYGIGLGIDYILGYGTEGEPVDKIKMAKAVVYAFFGLIVGALTNVILHEAGHLVGGLLTGYKFLSFRIFNLTLQKEDDGWHWKRFNIAGTAGQCLMSPPHTEQVPYFWYNVGGVLMNLIIVAISGSLLYFFKLPMLLFCLCTMLAFTGIWFLLTNGIPMTVGGVPNDAKNILILWHHPEQRKHFHNMMAVAADQSHGKRLSEMPSEWFDSKAVTKHSTVMELSARNLCYCRLMDELRFDEARTIAEEIMALEDSLPMLFSMETSCDLLLLELITQNRMEVVSNLWNKKFGKGGMTMQKYITSYSKYFPLKCATLFAYEYINNQSPESAQPYYDEVKTKRNTYVQPGEALTALAIMDTIINSSRT